METIKNYLESMFRDLPNRPEILKAKNELLQMMEDKYTELRREGKSENEAVATVISEFGNLDEVAQTLGIDKIINDNSHSEVKQIDGEEINGYIKAKRTSIILRAIGVFFFITCSTPPILWNAFSFDDRWGAAGLFINIAIGIILMVTSSHVLEAYRYLEYERCSISAETTKNVTQMKRAFTPAYSILHPVGIALIVLCFLPPILMDKSDFWSEISPVFLFYFIGVGVGLIIFSKKTMKMYNRILSLNGTNTIGGEYMREHFTKEPEYKNKTQRTIMEVYWPTITCVYLLISFLTFNWKITWIIWPIAGVVNSILRNCFSTEE